MRTISVDLAIIGGGPAGLSAAIMAAQAGISKIVLFDRLNELGGILPQCIHNGFGLRYFKEELTGPEYAGRFIEELKKYPQIKVKLDTMVIELAADREIIAVDPGDGMVCYRPKAIILAMGCRERPRGTINIPGTRPAGVFTAGTVQRLMNIEGYRPGNQAVILGSGDIGLIMARRLTLEGVKVMGVFELLPYSNGLTRNLVQCLNDYEIPLYLNHTVMEIHGDLRVESVKVAPVDEHRRPVTGKDFIVECDTLVLSVGLIPENELSLMAGIALDPATGGPVVDSNYQTSIPGIFACGNVVHVHDQVDDVSLESMVAGAAAANYIKNCHNMPQKLTVKPGRNIRSVVPQVIFTDRPTAIYIRVTFPERDVILCAGHDRVKEKIVTPGETLHYLIEPEKLLDLEDCFPISIEA